MSQTIVSIPMGGVNAYLIRAGDGFVLIDTGLASKRATLEKALADAGCVPGKLKLILLTHGDMDHVENAAYLRQKYVAPVAMHAEDAGMVEHGDMTWNRKPKPDRISALGIFIVLMGKVMPLFSKSGSFEKFSPDIFVDDGTDLSPYGLDAKVLHLPGHSRGSIGVLTASGDLFCGDMLACMTRPAVHFLVDDQAAMNTSLEKLKGLKIGMVYPGHFGKTFPMDRFLKG